MNSGDNNNGLVVPLLASNAFDIFLFEAFTPLLSGGKAIMVDKEEINDMAGLAEQLTEVNAFHAVPMLMAQIAEQIELNDTKDRYLHIKKLFVGGDSVPTAVLKKMQEVFPKADIHVLYGPTETTVLATANKYDQETHGSELNGALIGRPLNETRIYILDAHNNPVPVGVPGEICIAGNSVARGYLNQPELTVEKFVTDPFGKGGRMYKTGDLGKWLPNGKIEFIGRIDNQVKIRGFRIELGEIENALLAMPQIESALVVANQIPGGDKELIAYIISKETPDVPALKTWLARSLPSYMVPVHYIQLEQWPLNHNGKVDKRSLPKPAGRVRSGKHYIAPRNAIEEKLVNIWQAILQKQPVGVKDDFFESGGHSLKMTRLATWIYKEFEVKLPFKDLFLHSVLEEQALLIKSSNKSAYMHIPAAAKAQERYVLSSAQRRLWILSQFQDANIAYNMPGIYTITGALNRDALSHCFASLIQRHEILRTVFLENEMGEVHQYIRTPEDCRFTINYVDVRSDVRLREELAAIVHASCIHPFNLSEGPLLRANLYQTADDQWVLAYAMHHIISDGWSMGVLIRELLLLYNACITGTDNPLIPLDIQYKDYAVWQQRQLESETLLQHKKYWLQQLSGELPVLALPGDKTRPPVKTYNGSAVHKTINKELTNDIKMLSMELGGTLFMGLLAAVHVLLYRYTGQEDIIIGSPIAGREHADLENQIGFYVNTLPLRTLFNGNDSYTQLFNKVKTTTLGAYEHQAYPFDELVDALKPERDTSRSPLFDVMVVLQNTDPHVTGNITQLPGLSINIYESSAYANSIFDLTFNFQEVEAEIQVSIEYNNDIFKNDSISRMASHLLQLMDAIVKTPAASIGTLDYLTAGEKNTLLKTFNNTSVAYAKDKTLVSLFEEQVEAAPYNIALVFEEAELTYRELNALSNQAASFLRSNYAAQPDDLIGIQLPRSEWLIVWILGILKSGAAYVPIDPDYPEQRRSFMLSDSNCRVLIDEAALDQFKQVQQLYDNNNLQPVNNPSHLAYVIYTSGSTGKPKGVMIEHKSVNARMHYLQHTYQLTKEDNILFYQSYSFDWAIEEYLLPLMTGARCVIAGNDFKYDLIGNLIEYTDRYKITKLNLPPALLGDFVQLADARSIQKLSSVKHVVSGGDTLPRKTVAGYFEKFTARLYNAYGPTENTNDSTNGCIEKVPESDSVPIGKPIQNTQTYILDKNLQPVPVGVYGELYFGGDGLSRGYLNQPQLTAERFLANPFAKEARMYKTGDLARWLADGNIEFAGRVDEQVKIRGYRIELGEIEHALQMHPAVTSAVVIASVTDGRDKELVAYVVANEQLDMVTVKKQLGERLPYYMLPAHIEQLDRLPVTINGKVNKKLLSGLKSMDSERSIEYVPPKNEAEKKLVKVWQQILGREQIGVKDNFFEIGGNSIMIIRLSKLASQALEKEIKVPLLFQYPNIESLVRYALLEVSADAGDDFDNKEILDVLNKF